VLLSSDFFLFSLFDVCVCAGVRPFVVAGGNECGRPCLSRPSPHHLVRPRVRKEEEEHQWWPRRGRFEVGRDLWATAAIADSLRDA
jgi:hypothetical protein